MLPNDLFCAHSWHRFIRYSNSFYRAGRKPFNPLLGETFDYVDLDRKCVFLFYRTALICGCARFAFAAFFLAILIILHWFAADQNFGDYVWSNFRLGVAKICGTILTFIIPLTNSTALWQSKCRTTHLTSRRSVLAQQSSFYSSTDEQVPLCGRASVAPPANECVVCAERQVGNVARVGWRHKGGGVRALNISCSSFYAMTTTATPFDCLSCLSSPPRPPS
jgi:hypothetical protein